MKLTRVVPAVAAMAMLAACSPTAGTALVAGGQTVTEADLTRMTESCTQIVGQEIARADIVKILIMGSVFDELAVSAGQDVTEDQIAQMAGEILSSGDAMMNDADCRPVAVGERERAPSRAANSRRRHRVIHQSMRRGRVGRSGPGSAGTRPAR